MPLPELLNSDDEGYEERRKAMRQMKALLSLHPYGSAGFKSRLTEYEALERIAFPNIEPSDNYEKDYANE